ncbi:choline dehydrogenase [Diaporthe helianthi]|uniref:Choline dehydrogenase n=1 Tax=Diaporthe helianthi TaxID=158607 RepID=A0A2P5I017_DIAHE|nr:choline dehydrogenase [Diaporthe helianthi]
MFFRTTKLLLGLGALSDALVTRQAADEYDYIVIGSGPGGGTVASNVARAGYSVLLLEAGDNATEEPFGAYPVSSTWDFFVKHHEEEEKTMKFRFLTWRTTTGEYWVGNSGQPSGAELLGVYYPRGATVGGSSMINAMVAHLPPDSDWDYIANLTGDASWSGSSMRTLFQNIEHNNYLRNGTAGHGFDGWFQTNLPAGFNTDLSLSRAEATALGRDASQVQSMINADPNFLAADRDSQVGIWGLSYHQNAQGQRYSSRHRVQETLDNKQFALTLKTNSLATKILFNTNSTSCGGVPRATGVEYLTGQSVYKADPRHNGATGTKATARARKEIIISGGTFNTPQLLQLSGIGPASLLESLNIPVLVDAPGVGANLQDNQEMPVVGVSKNGQASGAGFTFIKTNHTQNDERDIWFMHGGPFRGFWPPATRRTNTPGPQDAAGTLSMSMVKQHVANRAGSVRITSTDPRDPPDINFRLYTQGREQDMGAVKDYVAWARRVHKATAAPVGPITTIEPPCPSGEDDNGSCGQDDEDWIEGQTFGHHCTSTAAIGAEGDENAVLDSKFRVRGVKGLRVADASVFPKIPGIFPAVSTFMVGQKAGEDVIADAAAAGQC